jgi:hypothetical protein
MRYLIEDFFIHCVWAMLISFVVGFLLMVVVVSP